MMDKQLYQDKKFKVWTINRLAETICDEWSSLNPTLNKDKKIAYGYKATSISILGEVKVTIDMSDSKFPDPNLISPLFNLRLSPAPDNLSLHVLNAFQLSDFMALFPEFPNKNELFVIGKSEPWETSHFARAVKSSLFLIEVLAKFDTCFNFLISETYNISGITLNTKKLHVGQYLNRIKAYRLAEIYNHPERLDDAINAIIQSARTNEIAAERLNKVCTSRDPGSMDWLYTQNMIDKLCSIKLHK